MSDLFPVLVHQLVAASRRAHVYKIVSSIYCVKTAWVTAERQSQLLQENTRLQYDWIIALTGMAVTFACLGRFSFGMLLPSMGVSLDLNYSQMGLIGTGNFAGYMSSVVLAGVVARAVGARWTISIGLVLVGGSMMLISQEQSLTTPASAHPANREFH